MKYQIIFWKSSCQNFYTCMESPCKCFL